MEDLLSECQSFEMKLNRVEKKLSAATSAADFAYKAVQTRQKIVSFDDLDDEEKIALFNEYDWLLLELEGYLGGLQQQFEDADEGLSGGKFLLEALKDNSVI